MLLRIGKVTYQVASFQEGSDIWTRMRDLEGYGASTMPKIRITDGGTQYHVSYNGKVWDHANNVIYDPFKTERNQSP